MTSDLRSEFGSALEVWDLERARDLLARLGADCDTEEQKGLAHQLERREWAQSQVVAAEKIVQADPERALTIVDEVIKEFATYSRATDVRYNAAGRLREQRSQEAQQLLQEAGDAIGRAGWDLALDLCAQARALDAEMAPQADEVERRAKKGKEIKEHRDRLTGLIRAHQISDALAEYIVLTKYLGLPEEELAPEKLQIDRERAHAEGQSFTQGDLGDRVRNLEAATESAAFGEDWRPAYNGYVLLVQHYEERGDREQAAEAGQKAQEARTKLFAQVADTVENLLDQAEGKLGQGDYESADRQLQMAELVGKKPEPREGMPPDVAGDVPLQSEQRARLSTLVAEVGQQRSAHTQAKESFLKAMDAAGRGTLEGYDEALQWLNNARAAYSKYPGIEQTITSIAERRKAWLEERCRAMGIELDTALAPPPDFERADGLLVKLAQYGYPADKLQLLQQQKEQARQRVQDIAAARARFEQAFAQAREALDCGLKDAVENLLDGWEALATDKAEVFRSRSAVTDFFTRCTQLASDVRVVEMASAAGSAELESAGTAAVRLEGSAESHLPRIAAVLAQYWASRATSTVGTDREQAIRLWRRAREYAGWGKQDTLRLECDEMIAELQSQTALGKRVLDLERRLRRLQEDADFPGIIKAVEEQTDDALKQDAVILDLYGSAKAAYERSQSSAFLQAADKDRQAGRWSVAALWAQKALESVNEAGVQILLHELQKLDSEEEEALGKLKKLLDEDQLPKAKQLVDAVRSQPYCGERLKQQIPLVDQRYITWRGQIQQEKDAAFLRVDNLVRQLKFSEATAEVETISQRARGLFTQDFAVKEIWINEQQDHALKAQQLLDEARGQANQGNVLQAIDVLTSTQNTGLVSSGLMDTFASEIRSLNQRQSSLQNLDNNSRQIRASLKEALEAGDTNVSSVPEEVEQLREEMRALQMEDAAPQVQKVRYLSDVAKWLLNLEGELRDKKFSELEGRWKELVRGCPPAFGDLKQLLQKKEDWLKKRREVWEAFASARTAKDQAGLLGMPFGNTLGGHCATLNKLESLEAWETQERENLVAELVKKQGQQQKVSLTTLTVLAVTAAAFAFNQWQDRQPRTPTPTPPIIVITATSAPTATPTITPTPTLTPTPSPTPEEVAWCTANSKQWVFTEPTSDLTENHAGFIDPGDTVGILRDVPKPEFQDDWIRVKVVKAGAETKGWIRRGWINCPQPSP